jgi:peptide/nickel transport system substrate-binding protein
MRKYLYTCLALLLGVVAVGCGSTSKGQSAGNTSNDGGTGSSKQYAELRWGMPGVPPGAIDYEKVPYGNVAAIEALVAQSLLELEPDGKVRLGLASSVEQPSSTTYVYHLRSVKFSDGTPMTSADVVFSLDQEVNGSESAEKSAWTDVASIAAPNSATVVVKLKRRNAYFPALMACLGQVIEKAAAEKTSEKDLGTPGHMLIGTGPWKLEGYTPEVSVRLSANPYWTGAKQPAKKIDVVIFKTEASMALALRSGAIDGASEYIAPKPFANISGVRQLTAPGEYVEIAEANTTLPPFNDVHLRRALAYATDGKGMIDALFSGTYANENVVWLPSTLLSEAGSPGEVEQITARLPKLEFNLAKAKEELAKSAYPHGVTIPIEVSRGFETVDGSAQVLASDWAKIGVKLIIHEVTSAEETRQLTGKGTLDLTAAGVAFPDPEALITERLGPGEIYPQGGGLNTAHYHNSEFDGLLTETAETLNSHKRLEMIGKLLEKIADEAPSWPLYSPRLLAALSEKYVMPEFSYWSELDTPWALGVKLAS